ncbi:putative short chain dehydrogenase/reductase [Nocardioides baekrokdamisoli]|uniref:Putative short chain dehydrogenase/reductase n=1 Tax=Nocardioides baekrokdamisoli TaxID=1804624 RepID=A0A3G9ID82_9ACTN|nr:SDR family oxidoreductase [Nocardioides baekrokdamisoli]BBH16930.1 putative short chain dehydrogenase/reductase [Nocardioides baekrokdamisoli]
MSYPTISLNGASVAITGGAQGIGRATAELLAARGAKVAIGDLNVELAGEVADAIGGIAHQLDVRDKAGMEMFVAAAEAAHGPLDVFINNAGVMPNGGFLELDEATDRMQFDINVFGVINGMRTVLPGMVERGRGHVVNVASLAGKFPIKGLAVYNGTKFAVVGLTAATRLEFAEHGVSISAILPSAVDTALASGLDMRPLPKVKPQAIAEAIVDSVSTRRAETAVPGYVGRLADVAAMTPEPALKALRRLVRDDRALRPDTADRSAYREALTGQKESR